MQSVAELKKTAQEIRSELLPLNLTHQQKLDFLRYLPKQQRQSLFRNLNIFLFDYQIIPSGMWRYYIFQAGRSAGKTYTGGIWAAQKLRIPNTIVALCAPTYKDVLRKQLPSILCWFDADEIKKPFNKDDQTVKFKNGSLLYVLTSMDDQRGDNIEFLWCDEVCLWADGLAEKAEWRFDVLDAAVRGGLHPQTLITSTPVSFPLFWKWQQEIDNQNPLYGFSGGSMYDNPTLPASYIQSQEEKHKHNPLYRDQEILGKLVTVNPSALFQPEWIDNYRISLQQFESQIKRRLIEIKSIIISIDPAVTNGKTSDMTGIIVLAQDFANHIYVLEDHTAKSSYDAWAQLVRNLFHSYQKDYNNVRIICEVNQGGDLVAGNLIHLDKSLKPFIKEIHASKGKLLRAEHPAAKYERGKVHHIGSFPALERQMLNYTGDRRESSPDHLDALVHGINYLITKPKQARDLANLGSW